MPEQTRSSIEMYDDDGTRFSAVWSRTGKRLIVEIVPHMSWHPGAATELRDADVEELSRFLANRVPDTPPKEPGRGITLDAAKGGFSAGWSRTGKRLIVTAAASWYGGYVEVRLESGDLKVVPPWAQATLAPVQAEKLRQFLTQTVSQRPEDR
jgi:hypothetical protein